MKVIGIVVFAATYTLISARRPWFGIDRTAAAILGAVICVVTGALTPTAALEAVDAGTLLLLFGMMGLGAGLAECGLLSTFEARLVAWAKTPTRLLGGLIWGAGILSALITNDAVCALAAPLLVRLIRSHRLPPLPFLLGLATSANTGSVATLVGNPQNMLCGAFGSLTYRQHLLVAGPVAMAGLALNHALLQYLYRNDLRACHLEEGPCAAPMSARSLYSLAILLGTVAALVLGAPLAWTAVGAFACLLPGRPSGAPSLWSHIEWPVLAFFSGLFIVVAALVTTGAPEWLLGALPGKDGAVVGTSAWFGLAGVFLVGSNVVSNVPFIMVVRESLAGFDNQVMAWELLAMASTFAGNLTLLGSVANVIVAESARSIGGIGFLQYLRVGVPLSLTTTALGTAWLAWVL